MSEEKLLSEISQYCQSISDEHPCGVDVEYDDLFQELERLMPLAVEAKQWGDLLAQCESLLLITHDLRVAVAYVRIQIHLSNDGLAGLLKGLRLVSCLINKFWDCVYPGIDKYDKEEPYLERINTLAILGGYKELTLPVKKKVVIFSTAFDDYSFDNLIEIKNDEDARVNLIKGLSGDEMDALRQTLSYWAMIHAEVCNIKENIATKTGAGFTDFDEHLIPFLAQGELVLKALCNSENVELAMIPDTSTSKLLDVEKQVAMAVSASDGRISSREDVMKSLDKLCEYYEAYEPSSPVPLLLKRAKKIIYQDFREILDEFKLSNPSAIDDLFGKSDES